MCIPDRVPWLTSRRAQYNSLAYYMLNMHANSTTRERAKRLAEAYLVNRQQLVECLTMHATVRLLFALSDAP